MLKKLKAEAREARKLLADKKMLQDKVKELEKVLETVQNQRSDLKQQLRVGGPGSYSIDSWSLCCIQSNFW